MGDLGMSQGDVLVQKPGNRLRPSKSNPALLQKKKSATENVVMVQSEPGVFPIRDHLSDMDLRIDEESGSEYGEVVPKKRKRRTNNSFAVDLNDDDDDDEITLPPPPKRLHFNLNGRENSVLIGVWKDSPPSDPAKKHAIYAFLDGADRVRQKIYPETRNGEILEEGYPSGTGRAFVPPEYVILDPHLSSLSRPELKEYIRIRASSQQNESPEERKKAENNAVEEAKKAASEKTATPITSSVQSAPVAPAKVEKSGTSITPKSGIPNGVLIGVWKDSDAPHAAGKHAAFGVVDGNKLRIKIIKYSRDGRPYVGNYPTNPGSNLIALDDVAREPPLVQLLRPEVSEYVKLRQNEKLQQPSNFDPFAININTIKKAMGMYGESAVRQGLSAAKLDAQNEPSRRAHNETRVASKGNQDPSKSSNYESPYARVIPGNSRGQEAKDREETQAQTIWGQTFTSGLNEKQTTTPRSAEIIPVRGDSSLTSTPKNDPKTPKPVASENVAGAAKADTPDGRAKAIRSNKAESDARAEKLRKVREAAAAKAKESVKGNENAKNGAPDKEVPSGLDKEDRAEGSSGKLARPIREPPRLAKETAHATPKRSEMRTPITDQAQGRPTRRETESVKQVDKGKEKDDMASRPKALKDAMAEEGGIRAKEAKEEEEKEREVAETRARLENVRAEMERAKADAIETVSNEFFDSDFDGFDKSSTNARSEARQQSNKPAVSKPSSDPVVQLPPLTTAPPPSPTADAAAAAAAATAATAAATAAVAPLATASRPAVAAAPAPPAGVKIHNDVKYARQTKGPFDGMLVGEKREFLTIDGENYVECRILLRMEF